MATKKNIAMVIATIKGVYPYYAKDTNIEILAKTWLLALNDYDDNIINKALMLCIRECEMPPSPAHIIKKIDSMQPKPNNNELWAVLVRKLYKIDELRQRFHYTFTDESGVSQGEKAVAEARQVYENMPEVLKMFVGSYGEMLRMSRQLDDESLKYANIRFLKSIENIKQEYQLRLMAKNDVDLLEGE